tara:strand:+ start:3656 stop:4036 length:381 start_codon:yes stop_codon:yes gene_type:complete
MSNQNDSDKNEQTNETKHSPQFNFYDLDWAEADKYGYSIEANYLDYTIEIITDDGPGFHKISVYRTNEQDLKYSKYGRLIFDGIFIDSESDDASVICEVEEAIVKDLVGHDIVGTGNDWRSFTYYG